MSNDSGAADGGGSSWNATFLVDGDSGEFSGESSAEGEF